MIGRIINFQWNMSPDEMVSWSQSGNYQLKLVRCRTDITYSSTQHEQSFKDESSSRIHMLYANPWQGYVENTELDFQWSLNL